MFRRERSPGTGDWREGGSSRKSVEPEPCFLVGVFPGGRSGSAHAAPLVDRDQSRRRAPHPRRGQPGVRRTVSLLLSAPGNLLRLRRHLLQSLPRRDVGKDAALLFPDAAAARTAGGRQVRCGPGDGAVSFLLIGRHCGAAYTDYILHGPGLSQLGSYMLVTALACVGYGAVFLMSGILFRNPMIPAAVVMVWENLNPFLPTVLKKLCPRPRSPVAATSQIRGAAPALLEQRLHRLAHAFVLKYDGGPGGARDHRGQEILP